MALGPRKNVLALNNFCPAMKKFCGK